MGASPLKTTSRGLNIAFTSILKEENYKAPSSTTIKRWTQQVGYYKLKRTKTVANDWMVLIDASIQMGDKKCILILGLRSTVFKNIKDKVLKLENLELLSMRIVSSLKSEVIAEMLEETALRIGKIMAVCSDRGSDILRGIKNFQLSNPETRHIADTAHRVSNLLEAVLEKSARWKSFREEVTLARRKMQNSLIPGALPPSPRAKARYMNVDSLIEWAANILVLLENKVSEPGLDITELQKYLGWLSSYRDEVEHWNRLISIGVAARHVVRVEGVHIHIVDSFEKAISSVKMGAREQQFADQLSEFLLNQSRGMNFGECFMGSTEVLESLFGKIKYIEREQRCFGFTSLLLAAMAAVGPLDEQTIAEAMVSVKLSDINAWSTNELGESVQSQRRKIKKAVAKQIKKLAKKEQEISGILEKAAACF